jgi:hypothetical protein
LLEKHHVLVAKFLSEEVMERVPKNIKTNAHLLVSRPVRRLKQKEGSGSVTDKYQRVMG